MPSPFPGMNPLFEAPGRWPSFHAQLAVQIAQAVAPLIGPRYFAAPQPAVQIEELAPEEYDADAHDDVEPSRTNNEVDTAVGLSFASPQESVRGPATSEEDGGGTAVLAPPAVVTTPAPSQARLRVRRLFRSKRYFVNIHDEPEDTGDLLGPIVTVIEILSPANKRKGKARQRYLSKRERVVQAGVSFVELDLLRAGRRTPLQGRPLSDYSVSICRHGDADHVAVWPVALRGGLPTIPIPLSPPDADVPLDLKSVVDAIYDAGFYAQRLERPSSVAGIRPKLSPADAAWARGVLEQAVVRA